MRAVHWPWARRAIASERCDREPDRGVREPARSERINEVLCPVRPVTGGIVCVATYECERRCEQRSDVDVRERQGDGSARDALARTLPTNTWRERVVEDPHENRIIVTFGSVEAAFDNDIVTIAVTASVS